MAGQETQEELRWLHRRLELIREERDVMDRVHTLEERQRRGERDELDAIEARGRKRVRDLDDVG